MYVENVAETLHTLAELGSTDISRRSLLGSVPFVPGALTNPQRAWLLWLVESQDAPKLAPVSGGGPVEQVHAMLRMFDEMDNHYGGGGIRTSIVQYLTTEVVPLLQQRGTPPHHRRELFAAAARLAAMAGWSSYDAGEYGLAQRYMTQASGSARRAATTYWAARSWPGCLIWRPASAAPTRAWPWPGPGWPPPGLGQPPRSDAPARHVRARPRGTGPPP
ncbi:hypothetical protein QBA36_40015 [Streptomyces stelliscabiei]